MHQMCGIMTSRRFCCVVMEGLLLKHRVLLCARWQNRCYKGLMHTLKHGLEVIPWRLLE